MIEGKGLAGQGWRFRGPGAPSPKVRKIQDFKEVPTVYRMRFKGFRRFRWFRMFRSFKKFRRYSKFKKFKRFRCFRSGGLVSHCYSNKWVREKYL